MKNRFWSVGVSLALLFLCLGWGERAWGQDACRADRSIPVAGQDGVGEEAFHVLFVPVDIVLAVTCASGETYTKGDCTKGQYARNGFYRYYPRWYETFQYLHLD